MTSSIRKIRKNKDLADMISTKDFIDINTGETLESVVEGLKLKVTVKEVLSDVLVEYNDYTMTNSDGIIYMSKVLNKSDIGSVILLTKTLKSKANIIYNNNIPHTNKSLQKYLGITSQSMYYKLMKRLEQYNIIIKTKTRVGASLLTVYLFNPYIAKKRAEIAKRILVEFDDPKKLLLSPSLGINKEQLP